MSPKPVLFSYFRSSASWRVRIALAYKGIEYETQAVHLVKGQQRSDEYKAMNPSGQVPTLKIDGLTLTQSLPIIEYLEEKYPEKSLLPKDLGDRAQARRIAEIINSGIQPLQNLSVLMRMAEITGDDAWKAKWGHEVIQKGFESLEPVLKATSGKFCVGDQVTIADVCLVPQLANANRFKVDMSKFPTITRIIAECDKLEAFKVAGPFVQPDCPEDLKQA